MVGQRVTIMQHPLYKAELPDFIKVDDFVCGSKQRVVNSRYVTPYLTEADNTQDAAISYSNRLARSYNKNISRPYLEIHYAHLSQPITHGVKESGAMDEILADITGYGDTLDTFVRSAMWEYMKHGRVGVLVDGANVAPASAQEEAASGMRSYSVLYPATHILEWEQFSSGPRRGKFESVTLFEKPYYENGKSYSRALRMFFMGDGSRWVWQRLQSTEGKETDYYSQSAYDAQQKEFTVIAEGEGSTENIPFVMTGCGLDDSLIFQNVEYNCAHLNLLSTVTNIIYNQGFQRSIIVGDIDETSFKRAGANIIWAFRGQSLGVHDIPPGNPEAGFRELGQLELLAMRTGLMQTYQLMDDTRAVQSAESKALDNKARTAEYNRICDLFEDFTQQILEYHAEYEGAGATEFSVTIGRDFGLDDPQMVAMQQALANSLAQTIGVPSVSKEILKDIVAKMPLVAEEGETVDDKRKQLMDEIDAAQEPAAQQPPRLSFGGTGQQVSLADLANTNAQ